MHNPLIHRRKSSSNNTNSSSNKTIKMDELGNINSNNTVATLATAYMKNQSLWGAVAFQQELSEMLKLNKKTAAFEQDPTKRKPTIYQKMGLRPGIPKKLTKEEWNSIEARTINRNILDNPCPICMEEFQINSIVCITSCGHVYHNNCLLGFEKCNYWKKRSCPMCRNEDYQRKGTFIHLSNIKNNSVLKIQSYYRGFKVRKHLQKLLFEKYPERHQEYCLKKLENINQRYMLKQLHEERVVDDFLSKIDEQLQQSRLLLNMQPEHWKKVESKVNELDDDCAICLCPLKERKCCITSCGHVFHEKCLQSFERFAQENKTTHKCPICRQIYIKKEVTE
ncbi:hypothetical protein ABK040_014985 [Willaertia magna]